MKHSSQQKGSPPTISGPPGRQVFYNSDAGISWQRKADGFAFTPLDQTSPEAVGFLEAERDGCGWGRCGEAWTVDMGSAGLAWEWGNVFGPLGVGIGSPMGCPQQDSRGELQAHGRLSPEVPPPLCLLLRSSGPSGGNRRHCMCRSALWLAPWLVPQPKPSSTPWR